ncbi:hypothetical protein KM043_010287 [Ampulex compressa]|nr:hypothetical protein KM043_010287 [Ampulex compressa]
MRRGNRIGHRESSAVLPPSTFTPNLTPSPPRNPEAALLFNLGSALGCFGANQALPRNFADFSSADSRRTSCSGLTGLRRSISFAIQKSARGGNPFDGRLNTAINAYTSNLRVPRQVPGGGGGRGCSGNRDGA